MKNIKLLSVLLGLFVCLECFSAGAPTATTPLPSVKKQGGSFKETINPRI